MRYLLFIPTLLLPAAFAVAQDLPQEPSKMPVSTEQTTNAAAQAETAATTNQVNTSRVSFLMDAGVQYADEGEYAEAEQAYLRALEADPDNSDIRFRLSTLYIQMKQYAKAVDLLEVLAKEFPESPALHNNLSWVYATGGEMKNGRLALRHAREALLTAPTQASLWNTLAEAYYVSGQYDKALSASEFAIDLLKMQGADEKEVADFEGQRAKIQRAGKGYKVLLGLDDEEK
jgi:tetratricopeptide (TPR) repeat protein